MKKLLLLLIFSFILGLFESSLYGQSIGTVSQSTTSTVTGG